MKPSSFCNRMALRPDVDKREFGAPLDVHFIGSLREEQALAAGALSHHDFGVLAAATAFGKPVVATSLIAARGCSALVLVHRRELLTSGSNASRHFFRSTVRTLVSSAAVASSRRARSTSR